jgi:hypothetical protein
MDSKEKYVLIKYKNIAALSSLEYIESTGLSILHGDEVDEAFRLLFNNNFHFDRLTSIVTKIVDEKKYMLARLKNHKIFNS